MKLQYNLVYLQKEPHKEIEEHEEGDFTENHQAELIDEEDIVQVI